MMKDSRTQMTAVQPSEGISLVFDQEMLSGSALCARSRSRSSHGSSNHSSGSGSRAHRRESCAGRRHRSSSSTSSSSSGSSPRLRSRSRPRCHRAASRSCCSHDRRRSRHSSPRRYRAHSRSSSPSSPDRSVSRRSGRRSHSRASAERTADHRKPRGSFRASTSKSTKTNRSRSRSPGRLTVRLNLDGQKADVWSASTKPHAEERPRLATLDLQPRSEGWVTLEPTFQKSPSQNSDLEPEGDDPSPKMSPTRKGISFSINNSVAKPTRIGLGADSKVIHRVESYTSRAPYGHWVPVKRVARTSLSHSSKHSLATSH